MSIEPRRRELLRMPSVTQRMTLVSHSSTRTGANQGSSRCLGKHPPAGAATPAPAPPFSDGTTEREKTPRRMMATSFYSPMLQDK